MNAVPPTSGSKSKQNKLSMIEVVEREKKSNARFNLLTEVSLSLILNMAAAHSTKTLVN
jgi:hypothetical protein